MKIIFSQTIEEKIMNRFEIIPLLKRKKWKEVVMAFNECDVYYLPEYIATYPFSEDGEPLLVYFNGSRGMSLCYVVIESDISTSPIFKEIIKAETLYDWSTPYGYGGPLLKGYNEDDMEDFFKVLHTYCQEKKIVSQFIRFHPLLQNQKHVQDFVNLRDLKETVIIDLSDKDQISHNMTSKGRNMVRKAEKSGVTIEFDMIGEKFDQFYRLYISTMERNSASDYFYFSKEYFDILFVELKEHCMLVHAYLDGIIISSSIILKYNENLHYHLSGSEHSFLHYAPNNLLLYSVAQWGHMNDYKTFHLGGGLEANDSLFKFKKSFNKVGVKQFFIGSNIFCNDEYQYLLTIRKEKDCTFNEKNNRMIQYREGE